MACVLQDWVLELTMMQQSVLIAAVRGPDGIAKNHVAKLLLRWYRRCILKSAFDQAVIDKLMNSEVMSFLNNLSQLMLTKGMKTKILPKKGT